MIVTYKKDKASPLTAEVKKMLEEAKKLPVVYDEDSPEMTDEMEKAFLEARKKKPFRRKVDN